MPCTSFLTNTTDILMRKMIYILSTVFIVLVIYEPLSVFSLWHESLWPIWHWSKACVKVNSNPEFKCQITILHTHFGICSHSSRGFTLFFSSTGFWIPSIGGLKQKSWRSESLFFLLKHLNRTTHSSQQIIMPSKWHSVSGCGSVWWWFSF